MLLEYLKPKMGGKHECAKASTGVQMRDRLAVIKLAVCALIIFQLIFVLQEYENVGLEAHC